MKLNPSINKDNTEQIIDKFNSISNILEQDYKKVSKFDQDILLYMNEIINLLKEIFWEDNIKTKNEENTKLQILKRYANFVELDKRNLIDTIEWILTKAANKINDIISCHIIPLGFDVFPANGETNIIQWEDSGFENTLKIADKFNLLIKVIKNLWINLDDQVTIFEEELNSNRMRKTPYKIIYIEKDWVQKTIAICDEIWQATFVYNWFINRYAFRESSKWEEIEWVYCKKIIYTWDYVWKLHSAISDIQVNTNTQNQIHIDSSNNQNLTDNINSFNNKQTEYRKKIKSIEKQLMKAWLIIIDNIWYFWELRWMNFWPKIENNSLTNFPGSAFNKKHNLWSKRGEITNPLHLKNLCGFLWISVATIEQEEERQKSIYRNLLEAKIDDLKKAGIRRIEDTWYFYWVKAAKSWPQIEWRELRVFPGNTFNKKYNIGNERGYINNWVELKNMFTAIWLKVATEKQEEKQIDIKNHKNIKKWKKQIEDLEKEFKKIWILKLDGIWYFGDSKWVKKWPKVWAKNLDGFPNRVFNKAHWIWQADGGMTNIKDLKKLFQVLWINIATEKQEIKRWKTQIEEEQEAFTKIWVIIKNKVWDLDNIQWHEGWPKINDKLLLSFPNAEFKRKYNIWDKKGWVQGKTELKRLLQILGIKIK